MENLMGEVYVASYHIPTGHWIIGVYSDFNVAKSHMAEHYNQFLERHMESKIASKNDGDYAVFVGKDVFSEIYCQWKVYGTCVESK